MSKIRVLVVDDAVIGRRFLSEALSGDDAIEVIGTASTGRIALGRIPQLNPDLVTLDVEMPEMDGLKTLAAIRQSYPRLPVIMVSALTQRGAEATTEALLLGANDYVAKPTATSVNETLERLRTDLVPKIKALCAKPIPIAALKPTPILKVSPVSDRREAIEIVAIGISTGGPNALAVLIPSLPKDLPFPIVIVQHMPPVFTMSLATRLAARSAIRVNEGFDGAVLHPGQVWIAPGDYHMELFREKGSVRLRMHQGPQENSCRPSADVLLRSVAEIYGAGALAIIMTGMGQDGQNGCECIRKAGGQVWAQDEASSVVWGMPGNVVRANLANKVLALQDLGPEIVNVGGAECPR